MRAFLATLSLHMTVVASLLPSSTATESMYKEDACMTYEERYQAAHTPLPLQGLNAGVSDAKHCVLMMMPQGNEGNVVDVVLNLRSMASELTNAGYHFYIVKEVPRDYHGSRENLWSDLPDDLHPYLVVHNWADTYARYPQPADQLAEWVGPGPYANHLAAVHFMDRYQAYEFAWIVEWDNRFIGNWGYFLNAALEHALEATKVEDKATPSMRHGHKALKSRTKFSQKDELPGFVSFEAIVTGDFVPNRWYETVVGWNSTAVFETEMMVWGGSRQLFHALHKRSALGQTAFQTIFVPTIAYIEDLKLVHVDINNQTELYFCCSAEADTAYFEYYTNKTCLRHNLMHPVKNLSIKWPLSKLNVSAA